MASGMLSDGTTVTVDGPLDPSLPLVVLLHGMGGRSLDMTAPAAAYPGVLYNRSFSYPLYRDEGIRTSPPLLPAARFYLDPPSSPTSWNDALKAAGFTTITYTQTSPTGPIAGNVTQLGLLVTQALIGTLPMLPSLSGFRVAFVGHSRGGVIARSFLTGAGANPALAGFLPRVTEVITLHSPNTGSGLAGDAAAVDALLARLASAFTGAGLAPAAAFVTMLRGLVLSPGIGELVPGSATLAAIAAAEPVAGVTYHTFGGTSTDFSRLWADVYTPDSTIPLPFVPFPLFHWGSTPALVGVPLNLASFVPAVLAVPAPFVTEIMTVLAALTAITPDLTPGLGDLFVSDARARLPFAASHTSNFLNHAEALGDATLQAQVTAILLRLRKPVISGVAKVTLSPYPARQNTSTQYRVTAVDSVTGATINQGSVHIFEALGPLALTAQLGQAFTYSFTGRGVTHCTFDQVSHQRDCERVTVWPTVSVQFGSPYGTVKVDTGL